MLTYLPCLTFKDCARILHEDDLRSAIVTSIRVLKSIKKPLDFQSTPLEWMWKNYDGCLLLYARTLLAELQRRELEYGILEAELKEFGQVNLNVLPHWFFDENSKKDKEQIMKTHKDFLLNLREEFYKDKFESSRRFEFIHFPKVSSSKGGF